jgi:hypothetical protein
MEHRDIIIMEFRECFKQKYSKIYGTEQKHDLQGNIKL